MAKEIDLNGRGEFWNDGKITSFLSGHEPMEAADFLNHLVRAMKLKTALERTIANMKQIARDEKLLDD